MSAPQHPSSDTATATDVVDPEDLPDADAASDDAVLEPAAAVTQAPDVSGEAGEDDDEDDEDDGDPLVREGDVAGDYLERLLDILDVDGDIDLDVEGDRASVAIVGGNLGTLIGHLQTATSSSEGYWKGPAAERFRSEWAQLKPTFDKFVATLHDAQKSASTNADNIEAATR